MLNFLAAALLCATTTESPTFALQERDVVVFLGGTNMVRLQRAGHLEARLTSAFAIARPKFRDLSWQADTVFGQGTVIERWRKKGHGDLKGLGDLDHQLKQLGTTVAIAQFGLLESMSGAEGLREFTKSYERLIDTLARQARLVVLVTPTPFEKPPTPHIPDLTKHNAVLELYVSAISNIAARHGLILVDLFHDTQGGLTDNGMHIKHDAQQQIADQIARQLRLPAGELDQAGMATLRLAVIEKHRLWYDYWRPANWKLLYGDDAHRQFTRGGKNYVSFREEYQRLIPLIATAEARVWQIAAGGEEDGPDRHSPEVLHGDAAADIEAELASFSTSDELQVNLFASEQHGLTSPLAVRWDPAGRMFVTVTTTYPHVFPGDLPNDKVIMLEDVDRNGVADRSTVFADGLNIPTGLEWGDGGLYIGQNTEILFLKDTDNDGRADEQRVVLGGFGNGDSHQTINSFIWSPGGELFFGQGDGCESRVETPWGASNLFQAGFYRLRPRRLQLHSLLDDFMGPGNPWGVAFDDWGQIFSIDGAGGVTFLSPGQVPVSRRLRLRTIGEPGGYCGISFVDGRHLPQSMRGDFIIGDFKGNQVKRFSVEPAGAGFKLHWKQPVLQSRHRNFRPVDVKVGPDGAIYVVDWYNPITCHQDDAYRDPTRDKAHGRIWRVSSTAATTQPPEFAQASLPIVVEGLTSPERWTRYHAKRELTRRNPSDVATALDDWVQSLDSRHIDYEQQLVEALGAYATIESVQPHLLRRLLQARDHRARAYAARMVGRWHDRLAHPLRLLAPRVVDEHPLVRMEAVIACAAVPSKRAIKVVATIVDGPMDEWTTYAFEQAVHKLRPFWLPGFKRGELTFDKPGHLAAALNAVGGREVLQGLRQLVESRDANVPTRIAAIEAIIAVGDAADVERYGLDPTAFTRSGIYDVNAHAHVLARLAELGRVRDSTLVSDAAVILLTQLTEHSHVKLQANAVKLVGVWQVHDLRTVVLDAAQDESMPHAVRGAAFKAMAELKLPESRTILASVGEKHDSLTLRSAAIGALVAVDTQMAADRAAKILDASGLPQADSAALITDFLDHAGGAQALAASLRSQPITAEAARRLLPALFATGRSSQVLFAALNQAIGASTSTPSYSDSVVTRLAHEAMQTGRADRGRILFGNMACAACHQIGGQGGDIGPDLTSIGTTLSAGRIVEELLWPNRQIKEGYSAVQVVTTNGKILQGMPRHTEVDDADGDLVIEDVSTGKVVEIDADLIEEVLDAGSPMPTGLTAVLSREQLLDLIRYLAELGQIK